MKKYKTLLKLISCNALTNTFSMEKDNMPTNENDISSSLEEINKKLIVVINHFSCTKFFHEEYEYNQYKNTQLDNLSIVQIMGICIYMLQTSNSKNKKVKIAISDGYPKCKGTIKAISVSFQEVMDYIIQYFATHEHTEMPEIENTNEIDSANYVNINSNYDNIHDDYHEITWESLNSHFKDLYSCLENIKIFNSINVSFQKLINCIKKPFVEKKYIKIQEITEDRNNTNHINDIDAMEPAGDIDSMDVNYDNVYYDYDIIRWKNANLCFKDLYSLCLDGIGIFNYELLSFIHMPKLNFLQFPNSQKEHNMTNSRKILRYINKYTTNPDLIFVYNTRDSQPYLDDSFIARTRFRMLYYNLETQSILKKYYPTMLKLSTLSRCVDKGKKKYVYNSSLIRYSSTSIHGNKSHVIFDIKEIKNNFEAFKAKQQVFRE